MKKVTGGRNGYGAKLANIFSKTFKITVADTKNKKKYTQTFKNNMSVINPPKIEDFSADSSEFTEVSFEADLKQFGLDKITNDIESLLIKRVYDLAGCTPSTVGVYINGNKITSVKNFESYVNLYFENDSTELKLYESVNPRWEVVVASSDSL
jgi:DNA topoisomerase-2